MSFIRLPSARAWLRSALIIVALLAPAPVLRADAPAAHAAAPAAKTEPTKPRPIPHGVDAPAQAQPIILIKDVRIGMKGYGLTVFHGTKIEPFAVEVVSVMRDFPQSPGNSIIWIRCPGKRMQKTGAVEGMSGSPIYLWEDGKKDHKLGEGGKLAGAFAYSYNLAKDCYVGVQPIQQMLPVGQRMLADKTPLKDRLGMASPPGTTLRRMLVSMTRQGVAPYDLWRARILAQIDKPEYPDRTIGSASTANNSAASATASGVGGPFAAFVTTNAADTGNFPLDVNQIHPLALPLALPGNRLAALAAPLVAPLGLTAQAAPIGILAGKPPAAYHIKSVRLQPGAMLSIPLGFGDMDLCAAGTVTDVLPNGEVLAFGHNMFGQGSTALPMATGYVHFVQPVLTASFKMAGSGIIEGAVMRDEMTGIAGSPFGTFTTAKLAVHVRMPGQPERTYHYQVVHHKHFTPIIAALLAAASLDAQQSVPPENTLHITANMLFQHGYKLHVNSLTPLGTEASVLAQVLPALATMAENPHESVMLDKMDLTVNVEPQVKLATIVNARLEEPRVAPGQNLGVMVRLQPYEKPIITKYMTVHIPDTLADGDYTLTIADAQTYMQMLLQSRPHLRQTKSVADLLSLMQRIFNIKDNALYLVLQTPDMGLAIGRQELPKLPSSRAALIANPTSTLATPYADWHRKVVPLDLVPAGQLSFTVSVRHDLKTATGR